MGRLVRRAKLKTVAGKTIAENVYYQQEFLTSSDMNFRPVNSYTGPDGHLYIVDMYRGIIQQGNWTRPGSFLREAIDRWGFAENIGRGRIYRLVYEGYKSGESPKMLDQSAKKLLDYLDHPNGWWRDNAQKQLLVLGDLSVVPALKKMVKGRKSIFSSELSHLGKIHSLWTLEGLESLDEETLLFALNDENFQVRKTAVWICEGFLKEKESPLILAKLEELILDPEDEVRTQLLLSLYQNKNEKAQQIVESLLVKDQDHEVIMAAKGAIERTENIKTYGHRLANLQKEDRDRVLKGATIFRSSCASCHGMDAKGLPSGVAPALVKSKRLGEDKLTAIRIVLDGLTGPIEGKEYPGGMMAGMGANSDDWVASVLSYARFEFTPRNPHDKSSVSPFISEEEVKQAREKSKGRSTPWTLKELELAR